MGTISTVTSKLWESFVAGLIDHPAPTIFGSLAGLFVAGANVDQFKAYASLLNFAAAACTVLLGVFSGQAKKE